MKQIIKTWEVRAFPSVKSHIAYSATRVQAISRNDAIKNATFGALGTLAGMHKTARTVQS